MKSPGTMIALLLFSAGCQSSQLVKSRAPVGESSGRQSSVSPQPTSLNAQLAVAAAEGDLIRVNSLLERGADLEDHGTADDPRVTPLANAAAMGHVEIVRALLARGADPDGGNGTPLLDAVKYLAWSSRPDYVERYERTIELLIEHGADVNVVTTWESHQDQYTPLSRVAGYGNLGLVRKLLAKGANVNPDLHPSGLPLRRARDNNHLEVVKLLKRSGAR